MMEGQAAGEGLAGALRNVGATLVDMVGTRVELALVELREEAERRKRMLLLALAGAFFLALALVFAGAFVVAAFWDTHRLAAIAGVTLAYLVVALGAFIRLAGMLRDAPQPFQETLGALKSDRELLREGA
ncbi:MAG TPA: phage holin family protein [Usitatibacter sp.]|jgi:uncharacterized membrane protein YqjE|nr:phage holin family protein [Usitatibacter sp.]